MTEQLVLFVSTTNQELSLTRRQAIDLELALNKSQYGHSWKHIGDALFNFGFHSNVAEDAQSSRAALCTVNRYGVSEFQMAFLKQLAEDAKVFF